MRASGPISLPAILLLASALPAPAAPPDWSPPQRDVLAAIERLSAATAPGGLGADAYAEVLAEEFSRWTVGSDVLADKRSWVAGVREWFDDGWRVADRDARVLEVRVEGGLAFVRRIVTETYVGPSHETSTSTAALAEVWTRRSDAWLLLRVDVHPMDGS